MRQKNAENGRRFDSRVTRDHFGHFGFFAVAIPCFRFERLFLYLSFNDIDSRISSKS